ncbi:MAG: hypothetical protein Q4D00_03105, partial [Clostridia bacterium]|nr:hypothetical protein [Clostridia bacterium]
FAPLKTKRMKAEKSEKYSGLMLNIRTNMLKKHISKAVGTCFFVCFKQKNIYLPIDKVGKRLYYRVIEFEQ